MSTFALYLFGPPRLERDSSLVGLPRRKTLALLAYLAVVPEAHSRQALASLLWPETEPQAAFGYLRRSLYELNQALGNGILRVERSSVALAENALWLDVAEFHRQVQAWRDRAWSCQAGLDNAVSAVGLAGGDFLAGLSLPDAPEFDEWVYFQSEGLRRDLAQTLEALTRCLVDAGRPEAAMPHANRWLALDPLNEAAHRALMGLYALTGRPTEARRQFDDLARRLKAELRTDPSAETRDLLGAILAGGFSQPGPDLPVTLPSGAVARPTGRPAPSFARGLPTYLTPLIGRQRELDEVCATLARPDVRLVSLVGPGGVGKTRLAVEAAAVLQAAFRDGAYFVPLAPVNDPATLPPAIAQAANVHLEGAGAPAAELEASLRERSLLLVLDNFEQLLRDDTHGRGSEPSHEVAAPLVARLLAAAPGIKVLVTSREALQLSGEQQYPLSPLALPEPARTPGSVTALLEVPAVRLFVERAQAAQPTFSLTPENASAVAAVCRRLDGLPLAIELAAARSRVLLPAALLARLEPALPLLTGGARDLPERQQTLRHTIAWSYALLEPAEQVFFRRLAVFSGSFDLDAAEAVAADPAPDEPHPAHLASMQPLDLLTSLVNKSLVAAHGDASMTRFRLLETIREFALEQLEAAGEASALRVSHARYYLRLVETMGWVPRGPKAPPWLDRQEADHDNFRTALNEALAAGEIELAGRLVGRLEALWEMRGYGAEGLRWFEAVLEAGGDRLSPEIRAWVLWGAVRMALHRHDLARTARYTQALLALREHLSNPDDLFTLLHSEASLARQQGDYSQAEALFEQVLATQQADYADDIPWGLHDLAEVAQLMGNTARAEMLYAESLTGFRAQEEWVGVAWSLHNQAYLALRRDDPRRAQAMWEESLDMFLRLGARDGIASALAGQAAAAHALGDEARAARLFGSADKVLDEAGMAFATVARAESPHYRQAVRQAMGEAAFEAAYQAGRQGE